MNCQNPKCGREIVKDQYFAESEEDFKARELSGFCRSKCRRLSAPVKPDRPHSTLSLLHPPNYKVEDKEPNWKEKTPRDSDYLDFVRSFDCIGCGWPAHMKNIDAHHIETGGTSIKCSDYLTVPLCNADARGCHPAADKSPETADGFRPYALRLNTLWVKAGHKIKR